MVFQLCQRTIVIKPSHDGFLVVAPFGAGDTDLSRRPPREPRAYQPLEETQIRRCTLIPRHPEVINGDHAANLPNLFIGPLGSEEIEDGEDNARDITQPSGFDLHGGPKASIEGGQNPSRAEICWVVHVGHWFGARETDEGAEIAGGVEVKHGQGNGLPSRQPLGEETREALRAGRSMSVTPRCGLLSVGGSNIGRVTLGWGAGRDEPIEIHSPK